MFKTYTSYAGIDPGFSGAIAIIDHEGNPIELIDMPIIKAAKTELDEGRIRQTLSGFDIGHTFIERAQSMPGQGISSTGRYMASYGVLRGICVGLGIPYTLVSPQTWKAALMSGMGKEKQASIVRVNQLYPKLEFKRQKDHGQADALLIALWGLRYGRGK